MGKVTITKIGRLFDDDILHLINESINQGFRYLKRLADEYQDGTNRFDKQGEALFIAYAKNQIVGICGLNQDPYSQESGIGRVRRLYVSKEYRCLGIGRLLMQEVIEEAKMHYQMIVLKTDNPIAEKFYCSLGFFADKNDEGVTHYLKL